MFRFQRSNIRDRRNLRMPFNCKIDEPLQDTSMLDFWFDCFGRDSEDVVGYAHATRHPSYDATSYLPIFRLIEDVHCISLHATCMPIGHVFVVCYQRQCRHGFYRNQCSVHPPPMTRVCGVAAHHSRSTSTPYGGTLRKYGEVGKRRTGG